MITSFSVFQNFILAKTNRSHFMKAFMMLEDLLMIIYHLQTYFYCLLILIENISFLSQPHNCESPLPSLLKYRTKTFSVPDSTHSVQDFDPFMLACPTMDLFNSSLHHSSTFESILSLFLFQWLISKGLIWLQYA